MDRSQSDRRGDVLREAARLFMASGFHGTSMDDIASALDFTKAALYHYFRAKSDILYEIYATVADAFSDHVDKHPPELPARDRIHRTLRDMMDVVEQMPIEVTVFFQEGPMLNSCLPRRQARELRAREQRFTDYLADTIDDAIGAGEIRQMDSMVTAYALIGMVSWASRWYRSSGRLSATEIADQFYTLAMDGLSKSTERR